MRRLRGRFPGGGDLVRLLIGQDEAVAKWVALRIPAMGGEPPEPCTAIGVVDERGAMLGGVIYHNWMKATQNIELSFAAGHRRWLTRPIICALLSYPFDQLDCQRVTGVTPRRATSARRFLDQFGFKREGCVRLGFGNDHAIISGLLRTEWQASKWAKPLPERRKASARSDDHRQEHAHAA